MNIDDDAPLNPPSSATAMHTPQQQKDARQALRAAHIETADSQINATQHPQLQQQHSPQMFAALLAVSQQEMQSAHGESGASVS